MTVKRTARAATAARNAPPEPVASAETAETAEFTGSAEPAEVARTGASVVPDTAASAARELRAVFSRLRRTLRETGGSSDLTPSQTAVLSRLIGDGPASASALAAAERVRPQSMAATLAALEQHGLVGRRPDPEDGRRQLVSLTEAGLAYVADSRQARQEWLTMAMAQHYTEAERATMLEALALMDRLNRR
ncbi:MULTISPECIES: MarR family winged helix-turn-helix transcriptional regulator [unclassified Kitasatospora]